MKMRTAGIVALTASLACGASALAENLFTGGDFENGIPGYEAVGSPAASRFFMADGGAAAKGSQSLICLPRQEGDKVSLRKFGVVLDPSRQYKLTVAMKCQDAEFDKLSGVYVISASWAWSSPALKPSAPSADWTEFSATFQPKPSSDGKYQVVICPQTKGKLWIDNIRIEDTAAAQSPAQNAASGPKNKIQNPSFEKGMGNWVPLPKAGDSFRIEAAGEKGGNCLVVSGSSEKTTLRQFNLVLDPERQYTLSAWMKSEDMSPTSKKGLCVIDEGWNWSSQCLLPFEGTSGWKRYTMTFTPRSSSSGKYQLVVVAPEKGKLYIDSIQLEEGSEASDFSE